METFSYRAEHKAIHVKAVSTLGASDQSQKGDCNNEEENPDDKDNSNRLVGLWAA